MVRTGKVIQEKKIDNEQDELEGNGNWTQETIKLC